MLVYTYVTHLYFGTFLIIFTATCLPVNLQRKVKIKELLGYWVYKIHTQQDYSKTLVLTEQAGNSIECGLE